MDDSLDLDRREIPPRILQLIPDALAREQKIIPVEVDGNWLVVATTNPRNPDLADLLEFLINPLAPPPAGIQPLKVWFVQGEVTAIDDALDRYYPPPAA